MRKSILAVAQYLVLEMRKNIFIFILYKQKMKSLCRFAANRFSDTLTPFSRQTISHLRFSSFQNSTQSTYSSTSYISFQFFSYSLYLISISKTRKVISVKVIQLFNSNHHNFYSGLFIKFMPFKFLSLSIFIRIATFLFWEPYHSVPFYYGQFIFLATQEFESNIQISEFIPK